MHVVFVCVCMCVCVCVSTCCLKCCSVVGMVWDGVVHFGFGLGLLWRLSLTCCGAFVFGFLFWLFKGIIFLWNFGIMLAEFLFGFALSCSRLC